MENQNNKSNLKDDKKAVNPNSTLTTPTKQAPPQGIPQNNPTGHVSTEQGKGGNSGRNMPENAGNQR